MKILFAVHGYKPAYRLGGPIYSVAAVAERLARRGHEVIVFTTNSNLDQDLDVPIDQPLDVDGVEVWYFKHEEPLQRFLPFVPYLSQSIGFLYASAMRAQLHSVVPSVDIVHTQMPFVYPSFAAAKAAMRYRKPLFYNQRGVFDPARLRFRSLKKKIYIRAVERPIMHSATTLIALTKSEVDSYRALGIQTQCRIIPNGVKIGDEVRAEGSLCGLPGISDSAPVILFMARLHPIKGADKLIEAFMLIEKRFPDAVLVMAGPDEFKIAEKFRQKIARAGLEQRVLFPGMVNGELKQSLLSRADLFCLPSDAEGFSMAVLEALAGSTAVILSPGCHFPEVEAVGAGRIVGADPAKMASMMTLLLEDRKTLKSMGQKGRDYVARHYSWDVIVDQLEDAYREGIVRHAHG